MHLVGHSLAGLELTQIASHWPRRVRSLGYWMRSQIPRPLMQCCRRTRLAPHQQLASSGRKSVVGGTDTPSISPVWRRHAVD